MDRFDRSIRGANPHSVPSYSDMPGSRSGFGSVQGADNGAYSMYEPIKIEPNQRSMEEPDDSLGDPDDAYPIDFDYIPHVSELSAEQRSSLPDMNFSSHMYSSKPYHRSVIVNGLRLKEKDYLDHVTKIMAITEDGVVLKNRGTYFKVFLLEEWAE